MNVFKSHNGTLCITISILGETIKDLHSLIACLYMHLFLHDVDVAIIEKIFSLV